MPITPTTGDIVELVVRWQDTEEGLAFNTFGFLAETGLGTWETLASNFKTQFVKTSAGGLLVTASANTSIGQIDIRDVKPGTHATYTYAFTPVAGPGNGGQTLPGQCAAVITWRTDSLGRSYRGRTYLPFIGETMQNAGTLVATQTTAMDNFANALKNYYGPGGTDGDWRLAVISRYHNKVKRVTPVATRVTSYAIRSGVFSQRSRQLGKGM